MSVALDTQHAKNIGHIIFSFVAYLAIPCFPTLSKKGTIFFKKWLNTKCVFRFSLQHLSETFRILRRIKRDVIKKIYIGLRVKYPIFSPDFNKTWNLSTDLRKILKYWISWKSAQWEPSCCMRADRRTDGGTDMTKLIAVFRNFAKRV